VQYSSTSSPVAEEKYRQEDRYHQQHGQDCHRDDGRPVRETRRLAEAGVDQVVQPAQLAQVE
jgi:hypothetical protein